MGGGFTWFRISGAGAPIFDSGGDAVVIISVVAKGGERTLVVVVVRVRFGAGDVGFRTVTRFVGGSVEGTTRCGTAS